MMMMMMKICYLSTVSDWDEALDCLDFWMRVAVCCCIGGRSVNETIGRYPFRPMDRLKTSGRRRRASIGNRANRKPFPMNRPD